MFQSCTWRLNQEWKSLSMNAMSGTSLFQQGLQKKATLFHILFCEMRNIDITRPALSAWNRAFQKSSSHNTCTEVPDYKPLFSGFWHHCCLSVCVYVWQKNREILSSMNLNVFFSPCLSVIHTCIKTNSLRQKASPPAMHDTGWPVTVVNTTGHV